MFTTLVAVLCHALVAGADVCVDEVVTDSYLDPRLTWISCQVMAQPGIAEWMRTKPNYHNWRLARWKCVPGKYEPAGAA